MTKTTARGNVIEVDDYLAGFGANLARIMKEQKINRKKLAVLLDCHPNTVDNLINGKTEAGIKSLAKLCMVFRVSADELLGLRS